LIIYPEFRDKRAAEIDAASRLEEARGLAMAIGLKVSGAFAIPIREARAATLFGEGQIAQIALSCTQDEVELVIVDGSLTAIQQRNLEDKLKRKVIDRTGMILEIFGKRAVSAEGRLQVELAHLDYQAGRLVRSWTHLERQRGGFGFLGGPGETQIEADRRLIRDRMARLRRDLDQVRRTRGLHRSRRERAPWPVIALVGYTNAGKSTLFNQLTGAGVRAEDLLFATLDPCMRRIRLPGVDKAILSDTVGFISDLPTQLVAAFRATLEEVTAADVIVHVRDISSADSAAQKRLVLAVLGDLGVIEDQGGVPKVPIIEAWNKSDLLPPHRTAELRARIARCAPTEIVPLSALTGEGIDLLLEVIGKQLGQGAQRHSIIVPVSDGQRLAWLHAHGEVLDLIDAGEDERGPLHRIEVRIDPRQLGRFARL